MIEQLGGRKFVAFIVILVLLFGLVALGRIDAKEFVTFVTANYGFFVAGNALSNYNKG